MYDTTIKLKRHKKHLKRLVEHYRTENKVLKEQKKTFSLTKNHMKNINTNSTKIRE